jgi:hypothetical protein
LLWCCIELDKQVFYTLLEDTFIIKAVTTIEEAIKLDGRLQALFGDSRRSIDEKRK